MAKWMHFEDVIFYLNLLIRNFKDSLELDLDVDLFLTHVIDDLFFIDTIFEKIFTDLESNTKLIEREKQLLNLLETDERFTAALARVNTSTGTLAQALIPFKERFADLQARSLKRSAIINGLTNYKTSDRDDPFVVSQVELSELLKD